MNIILFTDFTKKRNSTKQPDDSTGTTVDVYLKEDTSINAPIFILDDTTVSYSYVKAFGKYFFVDDIQRISKNQIQISCEIDVLATYKTTIGNYTAFVERSSSSYDVNVIDSAISAQQKVVSASAASTSISNYDTTGSYCLRIQGKGGIDQYIGTAAGITSILYKAYDIDNFASYYNNIDFNNVTGGLDQLRKILFTLGYDPSRYIVSLMWFPFSLGGTSTNECYMGFYNLGSIGGVTKSGLQTIMSSGSVSIPARYFSDYRDYDNTWSRYSLFVPGVGETSIDASSLSNGLNYTLRVDAVTGNSTVVFTDNSGAHITTLSGNMGVSQQIGFASPQSALMNAVSSQISSYGSHTSSSGVSHGGTSGSF